MAVNNQPRNFQVFGNTQQNDFNLGAGVFGLSLHATVWGTAQLQKLMSDGSTYIPVSGAAYSADTYAVLQLGAGQYRLVVTGTTGLVGEIALIARGF